VQVTFDDLGGEGAEAAPASADVRPPGVGVSPGAEGGDAVELPQGAGPAAGRSWCRRARR
jgi:hypothetical protein